uniref:Glutathione S-transferase n=1 Tax=Oxyrrhis marina TaxID=2969 RepID=A0A7S4GQ83_OXYMA|mmetsp:Transcript_22845/g.55311  ORF Transcript_22845/g.55311 Transcript_22845/m.55311 type:complete len:248 (-) Transcript_22845:95-838(-)
MLPLELYYAPTPNGWKVTIFLEEADVPYKVVPLDLGAGDQFTESFLKISPNGRMPAVYDPNMQMSVFESGAIMIHVADNYPGARWLLPVDPRPRAKVLEWLFWVNAGLGPMAGQASHFKYYAPVLDKSADHHYGQHRYTKEFERLVSVMDRQLGNTGQFLAGPYSIADIAAYPWVKPWKRWMGKSLEASGYTNVQRWYDSIKARPAENRGMAVLRKQAVASQAVRESGTLPDGALSTLFQKRADSKL